MLATVPGISRISQREWGGSWYWRFTRPSAHRLFEETFPVTGLHIETHGNVLTASGFLYGLTVEEFQEKELDSCDPDYEVIIAVRALKTEGYKFP